MTKLQLLHRALNERLMAAVEQIMEMVGGTVREYEVETVRARTENEALRRRLRWMEENHTDCPDIEIDTSGSGQPVIGLDEPVRSAPSIKIEPINVSDLQSLIPDASLAAAVSIRSADLEVVHPGATEAAHSGPPDSTAWDSSLSYMAPLDSDPTAVKQRRVRSRSKRASYACPDCGKVFGREQTLLFHMRVHSSDRPYACRRREACFYGDKKRKKKLQVCKPVARSNESKVAKAKGGGSSSFPQSSESHKQEHALAQKEQKKKQDLSDNPEKNISVQENTKKTDCEKRRLYSCPHCDKVFTREGWLAPHILSHKKKTIRPRIMNLNKILPISECRRKTTIPQKPVARSNEIKVAKAKGGGSSSFPQSSESHKQEHALAQKEQKKKQDLSDNPEKNISVQLPKEDEIQTEDSNVRADDSDTASELPEANTEEASKINVELESELKLQSKSKSKGKKKKSKKGNPEESGGIQRPRLFPCHECGKTYVFAACLITHERVHINERLQKTKDNQELLTKTRLRERPAKVQEQKLDEMQKSVNMETGYQDTGAMLSELDMEKHSVVRAAAVRGPYGKKRYQCKHCYKSFSRMNWLEMHMVCHNKTPLGLEEKVTDETQKNGDIQEVSFSEFSTLQNGNDGGKPSYTCPFCDKDFQHRAKLTVHMQSHICEKSYSCRQFYGDGTRPRDPDSSNQEPAIESSDWNGGFAGTGSHAAVSQDHTSPSESVESVEPQSVCSERRFSLLPRPSSSATSSCITNQERTVSELNNRLTSHFSLQPRIVLQPISVQSKICTLPEARDLNSVQTDCTAHVPMSSSKSDSLPKQQVSEPEPAGVAFSDVDSGDDNDWSDVLHSLDGDFALQQTAPVKLADVETGDLSQPQSSQKASDAASDEEFIPKWTEPIGDHDDLTNSDDIVATSVQATGNHSGITCMICGFKFASKPSLSQHMRIHSSSGNNRRTVNFKASWNRVVNTETKVEQQVGREQTTESQEASTNIPEIKEELGSEMCSVLSMSQSSGRHPDIDTSSRSKGGSETQSESKKPKRQSMERNVLYCCFCGKACRKIELHFKFDHPREPDVIDALRRGKNSKERKILLSGLCTSKSPESNENDAAVNEDLVHCRFCQGSYRRNQFWKHALVCEPKKAEKGSTVSDAAHSLCTTEPSPENGPSKAQEIREKSIKDTNSNAAQDTLPEELANAPVPEDTPSTVQTIADPHPGDSSSDASIADVQKTDPATANPWIPVSGSSKNIVPYPKSGSPVQDCVPSETQQPLDPDTSHDKEEMGKNGEDTANTGSDLGFLDSDCTTILKRKLDSQDGEITEAETEKKWKGDPSQPARLDNNLSDKAEAALQSMKTHNCLHCNSTFCSPHQCMRSGDTPPSLDQNLAKKHETLDETICCTTASTETSVPIEGNASTNRD